MLKRLWFKAWNARNSRAIAKFHNAETGSFKRQDVDSRLNQRLPNIAVTTLLLSSLLVACGDEKDSSTVLNTDNPSIDLGIPASLTGGSTAAQPRLAKATETMVSASRSIQAAKAGTGQPCAYLGNENKDDPFHNGYE
ncbi:MAG: hypothetical protein IMF15_04465, partial [Proteobacteria bacterium]|nr:hypothetical protein [Pseudomonadota bacterium]